MHFKGIKVIAFCHPLSAFICQPGRVYTLLDIPPKALGEIKWCCYSDFIIHDVLLKGTGRKMLRLGCVKCANRICVKSKRGQARARINRYMLWTSKPATSSVYDAITGVRQNICMANSMGLRWKHFVHHIRVSNVIMGWPNVILGGHSIEVLQDKFDIVSTNSSSLTEAKISFHYPDRFAT